MAEIAFGVAAVAALFAIFAAGMALHYSIKADAASGFDPF